MTSLGGCLNEEQRQRLLGFVRDTASRLLGGPALATDVPRIEGTFGGAFVTFRCGDRLRGCVGRFVQTSELTRSSQLGAFFFSSSCEKRGEENTINNIVRQTYFIKFPCSLIL